MNRRAPSVFSIFSRSYATKITPRKPRAPERPPPKQIDPLETSPNAVKTALPGNLTFIHRPPPSAPTPHSLSVNPTSPLLRPASDPAQAVPPRLRASDEKPEPERVTDAQIHMIRYLRKTQPLLWTRSKLAKKFNCTENFVGMIARLENPVRKEVLKVRDEAHDEARSKWGHKKSLVRDIRKKRKEFW
ncbi:hypothetical protein JAAARDRAFT_149554 [Jaapia argillacea MUCL 33604]|uniref:Uncharacterized protein n=1 Tax=Jaapia argillacea MUCL 33604 TaxID=933084 RepID=A0A067Q8S5_9AGAM|nr:hypothetical protein JAAARDRAFT_149554 [Jaapia argillacea MUCL 33604]